MTSDWVPHQVSSRLAQAGVLVDSGEGEAGREAVTLHFPEGIPRRAERHTERRAERHTEGIPRRAERHTEGIPRRRDLPLSAPQLVLGITVRLIALECT
jgi:hypothetical protein